MELITKMEGSDREVTVNVDFGENRGGNPLENLKAAMLERGVKAESLDAIIAGHAIANLKVYFRSLVKVGMKAKEDKPALTDEELQAKVDKAIPSEPSERTGATVEKRKEAFAKDFLKKSPEEQAKIIAELQAQIAAAQ